MTRPVQIYALVFVQIVTVALTALAGIWLSSRTIPESLSGQSMVSILVCALLVTVIAFVIQAKSQRIVLPERTALIYSLEPLFAVIFGFLLLNELLSLTTFVGGALVLLAVSHNVVRKLCVNFFNFFTK
jgi:drug/metabolite transporter (DMT)-like permease